ncbi:MAG: hypothetical protein R3Y27_04460 [Clostridia bacterium]
MRKEVYIKKRRIRNTPMVEKMVKSWKTHPSSNDDVINAIDCEDLVPRECENLSAQDDIDEV